MYVSKNMACFELSQKNANVLSWDHYGINILREYLIMNAEEKEYWP